MPFQNWGTPYSSGFSQPFRWAGMQHRGLGGMQMPSMQPNVMQSPVMNMGAQFSGGQIPTLPPPAPQAPIGTGGFTPQPVSPMSPPPPVMQQPVPELFGGTSINSQPGLAAPLQETQEDRMRKLFSAIPRNGYGGDRPY